MKNGGSKKSEGSFEINVPLHKNLPFAQTDMEKLSMDFMKAALRTAPEAESGPLVEDMTAEEPSEGKGSRILGWT